DERRHRQQRDAGTRTLQPARPGRRGTLGGNGTCGARAVRAPIGSLLRHLAAVGRRPDCPVVIARRAGPGARTVRAPTNAQDGDPCLAHVTMTPPAFQTLLLDVDARGVARLTLNRPDTHTALNATLIAELRKAA